MNLTGQEIYQKHSKRRRVTVNDDKYCAWLRTQRSAFSGMKYSVVAAHYRTAKNSGIGIKPPFSALPLTRVEHDDQHRIGQFNFAPRSWWVSQVRRHQQMFLAQGGEIPEQFLIQTSERDEQ